MSNHYFFQILRVSGLLSLVVTGPALFSRSECPELWNPEFIVELTQDDVFQKGSVVQIRQEARAAALRLSELLKTPVDWIVEDFLPGDAEDSFTKVYAPRIEFAFDRKGTTLEQDWVLNTAVLGSLRHEHRSFTRNFLKFGPEDVRTCIPIAYERAYTKTVSLYGGFGSLAKCLEMKPKLVQEFSSERKIPFLSLCVKATEDTTYALQVSYLGRENSEE